MNAETKLALAFLFVFCCGVTMIFIGCGAGKLASFFAGSALVLLALTILGGLFRR